MTLPFPLPFPVLPVPLHFPGRVRGNHTDEPAFGTSPSEVEAIVTSWRANGIAVHAIDTASIGDAQGSSSRVARALRDSTGPARSAVGSIGDRLTTMSEILDLFSSTVAATDARAAAKFDSLRIR